MRRVFLIAPAGRSRERLEETLESVEAEIVGRADDLEGFDEDIAAGAEIVVVDASTEPLDEVLEALQENGMLRETEVVLLVDRPPALWVNQAVRAGVRAVLPSELSAEQLATAMHAVEQGFVVLHPNELQTARSTRTTGSENLELVEALTSREREVLQLLARGMGNKEIAVRMKISEHTVKFHVASILGKLGASTRTEAVSVGLRRGLVLL